jgi:variant SH3 domain-containing protein
VKGKFLANKDWISKYPDPLQLNPGDEVVIGKEEDEKEEWAGWVWCILENVSGWVPQQYLKNIPYGKGLAIREYNARELNVRKGDIIIRYEELNGWIWGQIEGIDGKGWVPKEILSEP